MSYEVNIRISIFVYFQKLQKWSEISVKRSEGQLPQIHTLIGTSQ